MLSISGYNSELHSVYARKAQQENSKGVAAYKSGDWGKAIAHFRKAAKLVPEDANIKANLDNAIARRAGAATAATAAAAARARYAEEFAKYELALKAKKAADELLVEKLNHDAEGYDVQLRKLMRQVSHVPALSTSTRVINEGVLLGLTNTQTANAVNDLSSPWSKKAYTQAQIFATSDDSSNADFVRGFLDNRLLGEYTLSTPYGQQLIDRLRGTHFNRLVAHSNGATVAEALIRRGIITVNELNVMGGDRSFINFGGWNELITSGTVSRVVVWMNPGDLVPHGTTLLPLLDAVREVPIAGGLYDLAVNIAMGKLRGDQVRPSGASGRMQEEARLREYAKDCVAFISDRVTGNNRGGRMAEYRWLEGPKYRGQSALGIDAMLEAHDAGSYLYNVGMKLDEKPVTQPRGSRWDEM
jgi:hypothetical protein